MYYFLFFVVGVVVAGVIAWWIVKSRSKGQDSRFRGNDNQGGEGSEPINPAQVAKHKENLGKIAGYLSTKTQITNEEVQKLLGVSDATAVRYLDELQAQGVIEQVGVTGQSVYYKRKQ